MSFKKDDPLEPCRACTSFVPDEGNCRLLIQRNLRDWMDRQPCRIPDRLRQIASAIGVPPGRADDVRQDVALALLQSQSRGVAIPERPLEAFRWLATITHRRWIDMIRSDSSKAQTLPDDPPEQRKPARETDRIAALECIERIARQCDPLAWIAFASWFHKAPSQRLVAPKGTKERTFYQRAQEVRAKIEKCLGSE